MTICLCWSVPLFGQADFGPDPIKHNIAKNEKDFFFTKKAGKDGAAHSNAAQHLTSAEEPKSKDILRFELSTNVVAMLVQP
ncbi:MAG: hypothetical protein AAGI38_19045 [Bacteroidota bacterium]